MSTPTEAFGQWLVPRRIRIYGTAVPAVMLICWAASALTLPAAEATDFLSFYVAGKHVAEGTTRNLYSTDAQVRTHSALAQRDHIASPFLNPPFFACLFVPFSQLSYAVALVLWRALGVLGLLATLAMLRRALPPLERYDLLTLVWMAASFYPTLMWFFYGQATWLSFLIISAAFVLLRRGHEFRAGLVLGLMAFKPQLALGFGLVLLVKARLRCLSGIVLTSMCLVLLGFWALPEATVEYATSAHKILTFVTHTQTPLLAPNGAFEGNVVFPKWGMHHLYAFWLLLLGEQSGLAPILAVGTILWVVGGLITLWRRTPWTVGSKRWDLAFSVTLAAGWVASPHFFHYDLALGLLPFFITLAWRVPVDSMRVRGWTGFVYVIGFVGVYLTGYQMLLAKSLGWDRGLVQLSVPVVIGWAWATATTHGLYSKTRPSRGDGTASDASRGEPQRVLT